MNLRMQVLLRLPERSPRDTDELKRLEAARQKILATGQPVTLPVSTRPCGDGAQSCRTVLEVLVDGSCGRATPPGHNWDHHLLG